jgi:hypothetical protein
MNKKGVITLYVVFMIAAIMVLAIAAFFSPMMVRFNSEMYKAGEQIMLDSNESISGINNATIRAEIQGIISGSLAASQYNIEVNSAIFKYGWILIIGILAIIVFMYARALVEVSSYGRGGLV